MRKLKERKGRPLPLISFPFRYAGLSVSASEPGSWWTDMPWTVSRSPPQRFRDTNRMKDCETWSALFFHSISSLWNLTQQRRNISFTPKKTALLKRFPVHVLIIICISPRSKASLFWWCKPTRVWTNICLWFQVNSLTSKLVVFFTERKHDVYWSRGLSFLFSLKFCSYSLQLACTWSWG